MRQFGGKSSQFAKQRVQTTKTNLCIFINRMLEHKFQNEAAEWIIFGMSFQHIVGRVHDESLQAKFTVTSKVFFGQEFQE